jgi:hypothetical protein
MAYGNNFRKLFILLPLWRIIIYMYIHISVLLLPQEKQPRIIWGLFFPHASGGKQKAPALSPGLLYFKGQE